MPISALILTTEHIWYVMFYAFTHKAHVGEQEQRSMIYDQCLHESQISIACFCAQTDKDSRYLLAITSGLTDLKKINENVCVYEAHAQQVFTTTSSIDVLHNLMQMS